MALSERGTPSGARAWRANALFSTLLVVAALALADRLARARLALRADWTAERLSAPSALERRLFEELEDVLEVRAYLTGEVEHGAAQLAKRRLVDRLESARRLAHGKLAVRYRDPNASSEARAEALALGIAPQRIGAVQGSAAVAQDLYLGLVLAYRGREEVLPFVLPQSFEPAFLAAVRRLERARTPRLGLVVGDGTANAAGYGELAALLSRGREVRTLLDLDAGASIPADVDAVFVVAPRALAPRAAFALEQYAQRGGRLALFLDRSSVDLAKADASEYETGLEPLLAAWGLAQSAGVAWDTARANTITAHEVVDVGGRSVPTGETRIVYPPWPHVTPDALDPEHPVTARAPGLDLFWAHPLEPAPRGAPDGVRQRVLATSSGASFLVPLADVLDVDPARVQARTFDGLARAATRALPLAVLVEGRWTSPYAAGAPAPRDPVRELEFQRAVAAALEAGREPPPAPELQTTDESVLSAAGEGHAVVFGDADGLRDGPMFTPSNRIVCEDLADWLVQEDELLAIRARRPLERPLFDFLAEARAELGLPAAAASERIALDDAERLALEERAAQRAARRRELWMVLASASGIAAALVGGVLLRLVLGHTPRGRLA